MVDKQACLKKTNTCFSEPVPLVYFVNCSKPFGPEHFSTLYPQTGRMVFANYSNPLGPLHFETLYPPTGRTGLCKLL